MRYLHASSNGISALAVNPSHGLVAFGENGLNAKIFVYEIENLDKPISTIPGMLSRKDFFICSILKDWIFFLSNRDYPFALGFFDCFWYILKTMNYEHFS